tara:strand:- start:444 stop:749 length:306 start_codon:yes stop_codon:yes gene_type:complete
MPIYEYHCESCSASFDLLLSVDKRDAPIKEPCPECECKGTIKKGISVPITGADATLTLDKMCPGFTRKMNEIANSPVVNREAKRNIEASASMRPSGHLKAN